MRRRLDIALGLVHRPRVLFLDEPTTGLDPEARVAMWTEVSRLAEAESLTILLTTHYLEEADQLADRLAIVSQGKIVVEGTPAELKADLRGDAVQVELANGQLAEAQRLIAATGARAGGRARRAHVVVRVPDGGVALPGILGALDSAGIAVATRRGLAAVARRRLPLVHRPGLQLGGPRRVKTLTDTWFMTVRQARNLMREPIWIVAAAGAADGLARPLRAAVPQRHAARRLRHHVVHHVPRARDRRHERVLRRDMERHVDDQRPRPQGGRAVPRDAGVALLDSCSRRSCAPR